ncbi:L-seryl-tRNA(Sec) selenium transferase [Salipaludibacillus daqingensis]|uniref:L-seryl-tRNA(Sec) selenium transferase n=1 Tax=Salipaludibacillus daqingensis TaxID=3041001 RepID=UPI0024746C6E|nr:L-seryl-tRNA(Sec) selenium transferase [Salipaludibacillus daqingensis]
METLFRKLPPVHEMMDSEEFTTIHEQGQIPLKQWKEWINEELHNLREQLKIDASGFESYEREDFTEYLFDQLKNRTRSYHPFNLRRVINGTGTVLHTNLGRARLSEKAMNQVLQTSRYYSNLEYDIDSGSRGSRHSLLEDLLIKATGAEAAMVVNNNAAAVYLVLRGLTKGSEVVVSRGELVEIGGSFRVSTIMEESDATLVEVGTTNKTHPYDYENAISDATKMFMKVHTSNFKAVGFTSDVSVKQLKEIARDNRNDSSVIVYEDLGSGSLFPFIHEGIGEEPVVKQSIADGADIISFSGDKLLGGPQAGIIVGKKEYISKLKKHQLARVLRVDKMTLAALEATLHDYVYEPEKVKQIPAVRDILKTKDDISLEVDHFIQKMAVQFKTLSIRKEEDVSKVGGGTMPIEELPTYGVAVEKEHLSVNRCEAFLRTGNIPLITRIKENRLFIDFRTVSSDELTDVEDQLISLDQHDGEG